MCPVAITQATKSQTPFSLNTFCEIRCSLDNCKYTQMCREQFHSILSLQCRQFQSPTLLQDSCCSPEWVPALVLVKITRTQIQDAFPPRLNLSFFLIKQPWGSSQQKAVGNKRYLVLKAKPLNSSKLFNFQHK